MLHRLLPFSIVILAIDFYAFQAFRLITGSGMLPMLVYFGLTVCTLLLFGFLLVTQSKKERQMNVSVVASFIFLSFAPKFFTALLLIPEDVIRFLLLITNQVSALFGQGSLFSLQRTEIWSQIAISLALLITLLFVYGSLFNVYRYSYKKIPLRISKLSQSFQGLKVVQISDIHSGSLNNKKAVEKAIDQINNSHPDLIFFTGDLVNNIADEVNELQEVLSKLQAKYGVYSILGNHDYGDYAAWPTLLAKERNLQNLKDKHAQMGWHLLMNENSLIEIDQEQLAIVGVENWSASNRFPKYGRLGKALQGIPDDIPVLLLSHDPSHWEAEVLSHPVHIDATFSGHTHGMQFGIEWGKLKWSPVQYAYKQWAGLYEQAGKYLYVNRGFGVIGYIGRVGILPEITEFTLQKRTT